MLIYIITERIIMRRFKGFTLTELMVALAVIGILVAVVTPAIIKNKPNKNKMMVKKSFYTIEQVVNSIINDESLYPDMTNFCPPNPDEGGTCSFGLEDFNTVGIKDGKEYSGDYKFAMLFKDSLNVKSDYIGANNDAENVPDPMNPGSNIRFFPIFYTTDGIKWDLRLTKRGASPRWHADTRSVGTFDTQNNNTAGIGIITVDVNGEEEPNLRCTAANEDCDRYSVQILANGKLRIDPTDSRAVDYATINTSIRDQ